MLGCSQFLEGYSAYRDGELVDEMRVQFDAHRSSCGSCARYDQVIREGVELYRACPGVTPSDDFLPRLQHRIYHLEDELRGPGRSSSGTQAALTLAIAATIAAIAWIPAARTPPTLLELQPVAARAPQAAPAPAVSSGPRPFSPIPPGLGTWSSAPPAAAELLFSEPISDFHVQPVIQR